MTARGRHLLLINVFFAPQTYGGATIVAEEVAARLVQDHGVTVSAISAIARPDLPPYAILRAEARGISNYMINLPAGRGYVDQFRNAHVAERIATLARQLDPDLAHVHCIQEIGADCLTALKGAGVPVVLSVHDFWWICERQFMLRPDGTYCGQDPVRIAGCRGCVEDHARAEARFAALADLGALADRVTYPSRFARDLSESSGFAPGRGVVWDNGIRPPDPDFFERQAARRAARPGVVFGYVGGPSAIKGWPLLRAGVAALGRDDIRGLLVDGSLDGSWWPEARVAGLRGDWQVVPRFTQAGMDAVWAEIDVLLFLSQWKETFGLTLREALARGVRVIQTDSGGTMEHAGETCVLPIGCGPDRLAEALEAALARPADAVTPPLAGLQTQAGQAAAFLDIAAPLWRARRGRKGGAGRPRARAA